MDSATLLGLAGVASERSPPLDGPVTGALNPILGACKASGT
jgi:hypothetical protein